jgi:hypothetical protein
MIKIQEKYNLTPETLLKDYIELKSIRAISRKYNVSRDTILNLFKNYNLYYKENKKINKKFTDNEIIEKYNVCCSIEETAKFFKYKKIDISRILKRNNVKKYKSSGLKIRKYFFNEQFFDTLTAESAYWLGFISADGSIEKYVLTICLKYSDFQHLEKFKKSINGEQPITKGLCEDSKRNPKWKDSYNCNIRICSRYMIQQLEKYKICNKKSLTFTFPEQLLNSEYLKDFCRGYFDGDGGISPQAENQMSVNIRGTKETLSVFLETFNKYCDGNLDKKISFESGIYRIQYNGNNISSRILTWLYKDAEIYLDRKYEQAKNYIL